MLPHSAPRLALFLALLGSGSVLAQSDASAFSSAIASGALSSAAAFFLAGLLLSLTPCALPMAPILWRAVAGRSGSVPAARSRGLMLSVCFGFGMSLAYAGVGALAAVAGRSFAGALQSPAALLSFGALLFVLGLSSLGAFSMRAPAWLESLSSGLGRKLPGGGPGSAFTLGALCALVAGPCVAPPLAGALAHIARTGEVAQGALALFALAWGMCTPIVLLGAGLGASLPRPGPWMRSIQRLLGAALALLGWQVASPALGDRGSWAALAVCFGAFAYAAFALARRSRGPSLLAPQALSPPSTTNSTRLAFALGTVMTLGSLGAAALSMGILVVPGSAAFTAHPGLVFERVATLEAIKARTRDSIRPTLLEVSAIWCVECTRMRKETFPAASAALAGATLLELDVSSMTDDDQRALSALGLFGPPALLAISPGGTPEHPAASSVGFTGPDKLTQMMSRARNP